ncbi:hypothetical protein CES85_1591 [Ochrobactrum quorumnocens]|uniref:Uncharacterized protein n=1 Tax=Ochrobactrum quorumnocens TaxID=271865 RepID=A0A248UI98_9HYPH|nr:hypothetical protein CES85_1591 [[Ochrobactrum] quorumnocens]
MLSALADGAGEPEAFAPDWATDITVDASKAVAITEAIIFIEKTHNS